MDGPIPKALVLHQNSPGRRRINKQQLLDKPAMKLAGQEHLWSQGVLCSDEYGDKAGTVTKWTAHHDRWGMGNPASPQLTYALEEVSSHRSSRSCDYAMASRLSKKVWMSSNSSDQSLIMVAFTLSRGLCGSRRTILGSSCAWDHYWPHTWLIDRSHRTSDTRVDVLSNT